MDWELKRILEDIYKRRKPKHLKLFGPGNSLETLYNWLYSSLEELGFSDPRTSAIELLDNVDLDLGYGEIKKELTKLIRLFSEEQPEFEELREKEKRIKELEKELEKVKSAEDLEFIKRELEDIKKRIIEIERKIKPSDLEPVLSRLERLERGIVTISQAVMPYTYELPKFELPDYVNELIQKLDKYDVLEVADVSSIDELRNYLTKIFKCPFRWVVALKTNIDLGYLDSHYDKSNYYIEGYSFIPAYVLVLSTADTSKYDYPGYVVARFIEIREEFNLNALGCTKEPLIIFNNIWDIGDMRDVYDRLFRFILFLDLRGRDYFKIRKIVDMILESPIKYYVKFENDDFARHYYAEDMLFFPNYIDNEGISLTSPTNWDGVVEFRSIDNDFAIKIMNKSQAPEIKIKKI